METPVIINTTEGAQYRGIAIAQLHILKRSMELGGLNVGEKSLKLANGVVIHCTKIFKDETIKITVPTTRKEETEVTTYEYHFVCHPRVADSSEDKIFPLIDSDNKTYNVTSAAVLKKTSKENYGNINFTVGKFSISWRGPSGKYIPNPSTYYIEGLMQSRETQNELEDSFYTPFKKVLYFKSAKQEVLGELLCAGIIDQKLYIVVQPLPQSSDQVLLNYVNNEWAEIARHGGYTEIPCIFLESKIVVNNIVGNSGEFDATGRWEDYTVDTGELKRKAGWNVEKTIQGTILHPNVSIQKHSTDLTEISDNWETQSSSVIVKTVQWSDMTWVSAPDAGHAGDILQFSAGGGTGPYTYSATSGDIEINTGYYTVPSTNCNGAVSATITAEDQCGNAVVTIVSFLDAISALEWSSAPSTSDPITAETTFTVTGAVGRVVWSANAPNGVLSDFNDCILTVTVEDACGRGLVWTGVGSSGTWISSSVSPEFNPVGASIGVWQYFGTGNGAKRCKVNAVAVDTIFELNSCDSKPKVGWNDGNTYVPPQLTWTGSRQYSCASGFSSLVKGAFINGCHHQASNFNYTNWLNGDKGDAVGACGVDVLTWYGTGGNNLGCNTNSFHADYFGGIYCYSGGIWLKQQRTKSAAVYYCTSEELTC